MFTAFNENDFWTAIEKKDYLRLKVNTVSSLRQDPTFATGETEKVLQILEEKVPEIFEEEVHLDYEERLERSAWDKRYFTKLTYWFQENFAKSRIDYIKEVGRAVHRDTEDMGRTENPTKAPEANRNNRVRVRKEAPLVKFVKRVIAPLAVLGLIVAFIVKLLSK